jgi:cell wall assembly regulator SMI1
MARRGHEVTVDAVQRFEHHLGHELPGDYRRFLLEVNGGRTARSHRTFVMQRRAGRQRDETTLNSLFSLDDPDDSRDLATAQKHYSPDAKIPDGLLEIGYDGMGGRIILPLIDPHCGEVWYLDTEDPRPTGSNPRVEWFDRRDVWKLADSFAEFMAGLRPLETAS